MEHHFPSMPTREQATRKRGLLSLGFRHISEQKLLNAFWILKKLRKLFSYKIRSARKYQGRWRYEKSRSRSIQRLSPSYAFNNQFLGTHRRRIFCDSNSQGSIRKLWTMEKMVTSYTKGVKVSFPEIKWDLAVRIPKTRFTTLSLPSLHQFSYRPEGAPRDNTQILVKCVWKAEYWIDGYKKQVEHVRKNKGYTQEWFLPFNLPE